jgi:hypothetical protein
MPCELNGARWARLTRELPRVTARPAPTARHLPTSQPSGRLYAAETLHRQSPPPKAFCLVGQHGLRHSTLRESKGYVMTVTLNLRPRIEQLYLAEAQSRGLALEQVIAQTLVAARNPVAESEPTTPEE